MSIVALAGVALLAVFLVFILRELRSGLALPSRLSAVVLLVGAALALYVPVVARMESLLALGGGSDYATPLLRAVGIALVTELGAWFCRDLGETSIADALSLFWKTEILVLSLPLIDDVLEMAKELLKF